MSWDRALGSRSKDAQPGQIASTANAAPRATGRGTEAPMLIDNMKRSAT
jgi:hypothetical protein